MRVYGTSPLYNYVELIFRCKRMFIVSIILGTVVTSTMVALGKDSYSAVMVIGLAGDSDKMESTLTASNKDGEKNPIVMAASRKAARLKGLWLGDDPKFLDEAMLTIGLDKKYGADYKDTLKKIRTQLQVGNELLNGQYIRVTMTWPKAQEAQDILNAVYSAFSSKTVSTETLMVTNRRQLLEGQYEEYSKIADTRAKERIIFLRTNWNDNPTYLGQAVGRIDNLKAQIDEITADQAEMSTRLALVKELVAKTPQFIVTEEKSESTTPDNNAALREREQSLIQQMKQAESRYLPTHPAVQELQKQLDSVRQQMKDNESKPVQSRPSGKTETRARNAMWVDLKRTEAALEQSSKGFERKLSKLQAQKAEQERALAVMPQKQRRFVDVERDWQIADNMRNMLRSQLEVAKMDEKRDTFAQMQSVSLAVAPIAEKLVSSGKGVMLYILGPILGILIAFGFSLLAEALDHTLRSPVDIEKHLGKPVLAVIPKLKSDKAAKALAGGTGTSSISS